MNARFLPNPRRAAATLIVGACVGMLALITWPRQAHAGFLGHVAAYAAGAVAAHEIERAIDHHTSISRQSADRQPGDAPDIEHEGRIGLVFPQADALPNPRLTPGAINPAVTQDNLRETICRPGYSRSIRPPESYTERLKREQIRQYGYPQQMGKDAYRLREYEEDHLISLELGGSPDDPKNLWPQPHHVIGGWGSYAKDRLENRLHSLVCKGKIPLAEAQRAIATNWIEAYKQYVGPTPQNARGHRYGG